MKRGMDLTSRALQTRSQILSGALELFRERGFDETTMRDIAERAGVAVGAAYYYFETKDELVLAFYSSLQAEANAHLAAITRDADFEQRFARLLKFSIEQLAPYRTLVVVLARSASEPGNPLSPFSLQTREVRNQAIAAIAKCLEGSNLKVAPSLVPHLPKLLWFFQMGVLFFWSHDNSGGQKRTQQFISLSLALLTRLLPMSRLPLMRSLNQSVVKLIQLVEELAETPGAAK
jgi:AcrR family transcriptional regulator